MRLAEPSKGVGSLSLLLFDTVKIVSRFCSSSLKINVVLLRSRVISIY